MVSALHALMSRDPFTFKISVKNSPYKIDYLGDQKWEFNRG